MSRRCLLPLLVITATAGLCSPASAGIEPSPFRVVLSNRTDRLHTGSPFYSKTMFNMVLTLVVTPPGQAGAVGNRVTVAIPLCPIGANGLAPGQTLAIPTDVLTDNPGLAGGSIVSWTFSADLGIGPSPFRAFAFETQAASAPDPYEPPFLPAAYLTGEMAIMGFASPGVLLGAVALVNDGLLYGACPSLPETGLEWTNHGQYVRCVAQHVDWLALSGRITSDEADAIVTAAAQSETGRK